MSGLCHSKNELLGALCSMHENGHFSDSLPAKYLMISDALEELGYSLEATVMREGKFFILLDASDGSYLISKHLAHSDPFRYHPMHWTPPTLYDEEIARINVWARRGKVGPWINP